MIIPVQRGPAGAAGATGPTGPAGPGITTSTWTTASLGPLAFEDLQLNIGGTVGALLAVEIYQAGGSALTVALDVYDADPLSGSYRKLAVIGDGTGAAGSGSAFYLGKCIGPGFMNGAQPQGTCVALIPDSGQNVWFRLTNTSATVNLTAFVRFRYVATA